LNSFISVLLAEKGRGGGDMLTPEERALTTDMNDRQIELYVEGIGAARVRAADVGREEFEEAHRGALAGAAAITVVAG
jgi:hypothetical protein